MPREEAISLITGRLRSVLEIVLEASDKPGVHNNDLLNSAYPDGMTQLLRR